MLLRLYPVPSDESAQLVVRRHPYEEDFYREVGVQYSGAEGLEYALMVERNTPARWDETARQELIWYTLRYLMSVLRSRQWIDQADIPRDFASLEPPSSVTALLSNQEAVFSPSHPGGPFQPKYLYGEYVIDPFGAPEDAVVLGPLICQHGRGLVVRLGEGDLRLYRLDLLGLLAHLSDEFRDRETFLVRKGSSGEQALTTSGSLAICRATGRTVWSERDNSECEIWQLNREALQGAVAMSLASPS